MDISNLSKQELELMLFDKDLKIELKKEVAKRITELEGQEELNKDNCSKEYMKILKSMNKKLKSIDNEVSIISEYFSLDQNISNDIYFEDRKLIINAEKFYDNLKLLKDGQDEFKVESRINLRRFLDKCEEYFSNNYYIVIKNNREETILESKNEFIKWLKSKNNIELGIKNLYDLNENFAKELR